MSETAEEVKAEALPKGRGKFPPETIAAIRADRAMRDAETGKIIYSHAALAKKYNTVPGTISQIVRNRAYKDPNYTPVNDGK